MLQRYEIWIKGLKLLGLSMFIIIGYPLAIWLLLCLVGIAVFSIFGISEIINEYSSSLLLICFIVFSPYAFGYYWKNIKDLKDNLDKED